MAPVAKTCSTPLRTAGMELMRNDAALGRVDEPGSPRRATAVRRAATPHELAGAAGLLLVTMETPAGAVIVSRYGMRGGRVSISSLNCVDMRSRTERMQLAQRPQYGLVAVRIVLDHQRRVLRRHAMQNFPRSAAHRRAFSVSARPCIGVGNSRGRMWIWSSSCESCRTQSNSISSTLATAAMSPARRCRSRRSFLPAA